MKVVAAVVILSLVGASQAGYIGNGATFSVRMPFANPAGVTYIEGPAPAGLAAGPVVQTAGVYGAVSPVAQVAAPLPVAYSAAHVRTASLGYAAVPTVQHVSAVQDVPYTRIEATPGFVQKQVDVAKPAIATRKFEVRRPAIQKEFYDIEERVVVRPAGSAVVELDQPLSKTQKGDTIIQTPAVAAVAPVAAVARVAAVAPAAYAGVAPAFAKYSPFVYHSAHFAHPIVAAQLPQALPTPVPAQNPAQPAAEPQPQFEQPQQQLDQPQQQFEQPQQQFEQPQQQFEQPQQQFEQPQQQFEQPQQQFEQPQQQFEQPQQQFEQPQQQLGQPQSVGQPQQDNSDDTVVVGNPEIAGRSAAPAPAPARSAAPAQPAPQEDSLRLIKAEEEAIEIQRHELAARMAQLEEQRRQQQLDVAALAARQQSLNVAAAAAVNPASFRTSQSFGRQNQVTQARFLPPRPLSPQPQPQVQPQPQPQVEARSSQPQEQPQSQQQPAEARSAQLNVEVRSLGSPVDSLVPAPRTGNDVVPSVRNLSPEQDQENQQRLIELLTARVQRAFLYLVQGGVAEVGNQARAAAVTAAALDAGQVRARVLSATPAPPGAEPTNERVSTRRVVVSRPIQTIQEVDVVEPFTKIHRLSVQQPALFKTARVDVARVHTAVPVLGKALTPYTVYH